MISVVIPWIRKNGLINCIEAITRNAGTDNYEILATEDKERIGVPKMVKELVNKSKTNLVMFLADDTIPQPNFMINALSMMNTFPGQWGLVGLNDQYFKGMPATHWLAHKRLLQYLDGEFFNTSYLHSFVDNELTLRCQEIDRYKWCEEAVIKHINPIVDNKISIDKDYKRVYNLSNFLRDKRLFEERKRNNWRN